MFETSLTTWVLRVIEVQFPTRASRVLPRPVLSFVVGDHEVQTSQPKVKSLFCLFRGAIKMIGKQNCSLVNNYSPKWRWLGVDIYRAAKRRGKYPPLTTDTEVNSCFSIY